MTKTSRNIHTIRLQISEPWDFEIPGKDNILDVVIEGTCQNLHNSNWRGEYLLVSLSKPITWGGDITKQFLIAPRCEGDSIENLLKGKHMMVGIARVKPHVLLKPSQNFSEKEVEYFAIGSAEGK